MCLMHLMHGALVLCMVSVLSIASASLPHHRPILFPLMMQSAIFHSAIFLCPAILLLQAPRTAATDSSELLVDTVGCSGVPTGLDKADN